MSSIELKKFCIYFYFDLKLLFEVVNLMRFGKRKCVDDFLDWFDIVVVWFIKIGKIWIKIELLNFIFIHITVKNYLLFKIQTVLRPLHTFKKTILFFKVILHQQFKPSNRLKKSYHTHHARDRLWSRIKHLQEGYCIRIYLEWRCGLRIV